MSQTELGQRRDTATYSLDYAEVVRWAKLMGQFDGQEHMANPDNEKFSCKVFYESGVYSKFDAKARKLFALAYSRSYNDARNSKANS